MRLSITGFFVILCINYAFATTPMIIVHGGAGEVARSRFAGKYRGTILAAQIGYDILLKNGSAVDAVEQAIRSLEIDPDFNASYGSSLNSDGEVEMDASIMDGNTMKTGAVTGVQDIYHTISLARKVMDKTPYNFLGTKGAMKLARDEGFNFLPKGTLVTQRALDALEAWRNRQNSTLKESVGEGGTVGAVAIDIHGNIAAGTSTGGLTGKMPGRIGDTPLVGIATYADNELGALSATGTGEVIMKSVLVYDILKKVEYQGKDIQSAAKEACDKMLERFEDDGGVIGLDKDGNVAIAFSSLQMSWAYMNGTDTVYYGLEKSGDSYVVNEYDVEECKNKQCIH